MILIVFPSKHLISSLVLSVLVVGPDSIFGFMDLLKPNEIFLSVIFDDLLYPFLVATLFSSEKTPTHEIRKQTRTK